jgi:PAS domain S-box-containing protein
VLVTSARSSSRKRGSGEAAAIGLVIFVCLAFIGMDGWRTWQVRDTQLTESQVAAENMARSLAQHAELSIVQVDLVLTGIVERLRASGSPQDEADRLHDLMAARVEELPQIRELVVLDTAGNWRVSSVSALPPAINNSDRAYFKFHRDHPDSGCLVSAPVVSHSTGKWTITVSRGLHDEHGAFAGVVLAAVNPEFFQRFYDTFNIGRHGTISLLHDDGTLIVRRPFDEANVGRTLADTPLIANYLPASPSGTFQGASSVIDGVARLYAYRRLASFPLVVVAALAQDDVLAGWRSDALLHLVAGGVLVAVILLLGLRLASQIRAGARAKEALNQSEALYRLLAENSTDMIVRLSLDGVRRFVSPGSRTLLGYDPDELINIGYRDLLHPDDVNANRAIFEEVASGSGPRISTYRMRNKQGHYIWVEAAKRLVPDADGVEMLSVIRNISQRKEAEARLLDAIENVNDGFILWDDEQRLVMCNSRYRSMYAVSASLLVPGATMREILAGGARLGQYGPIDDPEAFAEILVAGAAAGAVFERRLVDGRWMLGSNRRTSLGAWVGVRTDITEQKQRQEELDEIRTTLERQAAELVGLAEDLATAKTAAEAASDAKSTFLASMSHEIRTPMNGVVGMNNLLLDTELTTEQRAQAEAVRDSAEALLTIINDILDISKLEAGRLQIESIDFDLEKVVDSVVDLLAPQARDKGLRFGGIVDASARGCFRGDPTRLRQILTNLAGNAVKFTASGFVTIDARRADDSGTPMLQFSVTDTGIGISAEARQFLFTKFSQADSSITRRFGGTGLGLAICKQLVELMGGVIAIESEEGNGSVFKFGIPVVPALAMSRAEGPSSKLAGLRALVVDDVEINRRICRGQLEGFGLVVAEAPDAASALATLRCAADPAAAFDLIVIDHHMPETSGPMLGREIRSSWPEIAAKLILMSSSPLGRDEDAPVRETFDAVLIKPVHRHPLLQCLARLFDPQPAATAARALPRQDTGRRILVAEDNLINQRIAVGLLRKAGHEVDIASDGIEAVAAVKSTHYDLVLMDVQMPRCDGLEATRQIRALPPAQADVPIVAMTAHAMQGAREEYLSAGMNDYVSKPFDPRVFTAMVERWTSVGAAHEAAALTATSGAAPAVFDESFIEDFAEILPDEEFEVLVQQWLAGTADRLNRIAALAEAGDLAALGQTAHDLVSTAGSFGLLLASSLARQLASACRASDAALARSLPAEIIAASEPALVAIRTRFGRAARSAA